eukprot:362270-Chlamydomonas_euryale.AAC.6
MESVSRKAGECKRGREGKRSGGRGGPSARRKWSYPLDARGRDELGGRNSGQKGRNVCTRPGAKTKGLGANDASTSSNISTCPANGAPQTVHRLGCMPCKRSGPRTLMGPSGLGLSEPSGASKLLCRLLSPMEWVVCEKGTHGSAGGQAMSEGRV